VIYKFHVSLKKEKAFGSTEKFISLKAKKEPLLKQFFTRFFEQW